MTTYLLFALVLAPLFGLAVCSLLPRRRESVIFCTAMGVVAVMMALFAVLSLTWAFGGTETLLAQSASISPTSNYELSLVLQFDIVALVFFAMALIMTFLVFAFSRYYMHRESGFKRFYGTVLLFLAGITLIIFAGNFEVLLVGWEIIGITSVLLIAFYRDRFLPARNALKVFSVYRIADAFLLGAIWYAHHVFDSSVHFSELSAVAANHDSELIILGLLLLMAALIKSAQFPFSYWLPRAMEGPTTSSAIFYGALSVHMGLFLLLRTYPLWDGLIMLHIAVGIVGVITAFSAASIARVQSSMKTQIAYASIAQIGIMFVELALGLWWLALIHFVCNASLRTYQLLISPSSVGYLVHHQFFHFVTPVHKASNTFMGRIYATVFVLSIKEWNMDLLATKFIWRPLKVVGRRLYLLETKVGMGLFAFVVASLLILSVRLPDLRAAVSIVAALVAILYCVRAYTTKGTALAAWRLTMMGYTFGALFLLLGTTHVSRYALLYYCGIAVAYLSGWICLHYLRKHEGMTNLRNYNGSIYAFKGLGHVFFIVCLLFIAFPIGPSFLAQDVLLSDIPTSKYYAVVLFCFVYLMAGISIMRIYVKTFFGPHKTSRQEVAYRSS